LLFVTQTENPPRDQEAETPRKESPEDMHKALRFKYVTHAYYSNTIYQHASGS